MKTIKTKQFFNIQNSLLSIPKDFTSNQKLILAKIILKYQFDEKVKHKDKPRISMSYIANGTNICLKSVQNGIKALIEKKLVYVEECINYYPTLEALDLYSDTGMYEDYNEENDSGGMGDNYTELKIIKGLKSSENIVFSWIYSLKYYEEKYRYFTIARLVEAVGIQKAGVIKIIKSLVEKGLIVLNEVVGIRGKISYHLVSIDDKLIQSLIHNPNPDTAFIERPAFSKHKTSVSNFLPPESNYLPDVSELLPLESNCQQVDPNFQHVDPKSYNETINKTHNENHNKTNNETIKNSKKSNDFFEDNLDTSMKGMFNENVSEEDWMVSALDKLCQCLEH